MRRGRSAGRADTVSSVPLSVILGAATLCLVWGTTWGAIKIAVEHVPPFLFAFDRALLVAVILAFVSVVARQRFPRGRRELAAIAFAGGINIGLSWAILFWAEQYVPSGLASIFGASAPIWTALGAHFFVADDRLTPWKIVALALGFGGVLVLVGAEDITGAGPLATVLLAFMPMMWAAAAIVSRLYLQRVAPIPTTSLQAAAGAIVLIPFALTDLGRPASWEASSLLALGYLVVFGTCVAFVVFVWLLQRLRPTTVLLFQVVYPAEAVLIGSAFLGEPLTARLLVGFVLVAVAVLLNALTPAGHRPVDVTTTQA